MTTNQKSIPFAALDTTSSSLLHRSASKLLGKNFNRTSSTIKIYIAAISLTYVPMLIAALLSPFSLVIRTKALRLPFLLDWNIECLFLLTFPILLVLTLRDETVLRSSLERIHADSVMVVQPARWHALLSEWKTRFKILNIIAQVVGLGTGLLLAWLNYWAYTPVRVGFWISSEGKLIPVGVVFLWCIWLFYALVPLYVLRNVGISWFLKNVVEHAEIDVLPFHPDQSGGLRPVGQIGLRNQYGLTVIGANVVLLVFVSVRYLQTPPLLNYLMLAASIAYLVLGPIVFLGPLLPFREGMVRTKTELMNKIAMRLRVELHRLQKQLQSGAITKDDEELVERLRKLGAVVDQLPVWPFDLNTLRRFLGAYFTPLLGAGVLKTVFTVVVGVLRH